MPLRYGVCQVRAVSGQRDEGVDLALSMADLVDVIGARVGTRNAANADENIVSFRTLLWCLGRCCPRARSTYAVKRPAVANCFVVASARRRATLVTQALGTLVGAWKEGAYR